MHPFTFWMALNLDTDSCILAVVKLVQRQLVLLHALDVRWGHNRHPMCSVNWTVVVSWYLYTILRDNEWQCETKSCAYIHVDSMPLLLLCWVIWLYVTVNSLTGKLLRFQKLLAVVQRKSFKNTITITTVTIITKIMITKPELWPIWETFVLLLWLTWLLQSSHLSFSSSRFRYRRKEKQAKPSMSVTSREMREETRQEKDRHSRHRRKTH